MLVFAGRSLPTICLQGVVRIEGQPKSWCGLAKPADRSLGEASFSRFDPGPARDRLTALHVVCLLR